MGKSFELLGLAAFNLFLALILSVTFLSGGGKNPDQGRLTESRVTSFIQEVTDISTGKRSDMDRYSITSFFMDHIADNGKFINTVQYDLPRVQAQEQVLEMNKLSFISHILQGMDTEREEAEIHIEYIEILDEGRTAKIITTNTERGMMPYDDGSGRPQYMPVRGQSFCEQTLALNNRHIQMVEATCSTAIQLARY